MKLRDRELVVSLALLTWLIAPIGCDSESPDAPSTADMTEDAPADEEATDALDATEDAPTEDAVSTDGEELVWAECGAPPPGQVTFLGDSFDALLRLLWDDHWSPDGNWDGDMMGDATAFAPELLFPLAQLTGCLDLNERALATVEYEADLAWQYVQTGANEMETIVGAPALITGYEWTGSLEYKLMAVAGLQVLADQVLQDPEALRLFYMPPVALGSTAYYILQYTAVSGDRTLFERALTAIDLANERYWDDDNGYYGELWDWSQAMMLMALASAYDQTGDAAYLERALQLAGNVLELMWDEERGGFWATHRDDEVGKGLSGQAFMTRAFLTLYMATCDDAYLSVAAQTLEYSFGPDLYHEGFIRHDWTPDHGTSPDVCTGCNFFTLSNLWIYDRLVAQGCTREEP